MNTMQKIRMGMVGGGEGAFIGAIHRMAAVIDGEIELVCGAFSQEPERARQSGATIGLPPHRVYTSYQDMMRAEAELPRTERMQFVAIVTPNHLHYPVASAALNAGFHVLSEKPATLSLEECKRLKQQLTQTELLFGLTHTYAGYPMVKEAKARVAAGEIGSIYKIVVEYTQGWLAQREEMRGNKQAQWRLDPARAGISSCMADIGVHAAHLAEYISGLTITQLGANLSSIVSDRCLDDDGLVWLGFDNEARGVLIASQVCNGEENALSIRIYGDKGSLEWRQQEPNSLWLKWPDRPAQLLRAGAPYLCALAQANTRLPMGHPEGYIEAFANVYRAFAAQIRAKEFNTTPAPIAADCPGIEEAIRGMQFIESVVAANASEKKWLPLVT